MAQNDVEVIIYKSLFLRYTMERKCRIAITQNRYSFLKNPPQHPNRRSELITSGGGLLFMVYGNEV